ncbi:MAG: DNA-3-methyladenine glycosylase I [Candidatus Eremiobacteraeota bacterium]|nr:DNA-3-methyladenine glycosylase I [Candidatus Eremiobacteraeota bacterium]
MAIPRQIEPQSLADYLAVISRAIFQAGLSWALIESKWPAYERLFCGFDPKIVATFDDHDIDVIATDPGIVRTRKKIAATVENARTLLALEREHGAFADYLRSFDSYEALSADLRRRFKFLGELGAYYFLFRVKEPVPPFEEWEKTIPGEHPRMREMVAVARGEPLPSPPPRGFSRRRKRSAERPSTAE